jgi:hypothetical protein
MGSIDSVASAAGGDHKSEESIMLAKYNIVDLKKLRLIYREVLKLLIATFLPCFPGESRI